MTIRKTVGENVAQLRKERELSQEELGKLVDLNRQTIWRIENGSANVKVETIEDLAKALKVAPEDLICSTYPGSAEDGDDDGVAKKRLVAQRLVGSLKTASKELTNATKDALALLPGL